MTYYNGIKFINQKVLDDGTRVSFKFDESLSNRKVITTTKDVIDKINSIKDINDKYNAIKDTNISDNLKRTLINEWIKRPYTESNESNIESDVYSVLSDKPKLKVVKKTIWKNPFLLFPVKKSLHKRVDEVIEKGYKYYVLKIKVQKSKNTRARTGRGSKPTTHRVNLEVTLDNFKTHSMDNYDLFNRIIKPINWMIHKYNMAHEVWDRVEFTPDDVKISDDFLVEYSNDILESTSTDIKIVLSTSNFSKPSVTPTIRIKVKLGGQIIEW